VQLEGEAGIGRFINIPDSDYEKEAVSISRDRKASFAHADMVLQMDDPGSEDISYLKEGQIYVGCISPFDAAEVVTALAAQKVSAISLAMIPRTAVTQKMDVLSSQASLGGYEAVILAAEHQGIIFPMMMTPAGTIQPARVFVIGAGVAGLQAIATAKRLGARTDAFDVRPDAQEQIMSLGARPLNVDLGPATQTKDGYAKELTDEQLQKQRQAITEQCAQSDVVTTGSNIY